MWASLIAAAIAAWLHQLTGLISGGELVEGHGTRGGKAMIATLRRALIATPARLVSHGGQLIMRLAPGAVLLPGILAASAPCPPPAKAAARHHPRPPRRHRHTVPRNRPPRPGPAERPEPANPAPHPGYQHARTPPPATPRSSTSVDNLRRPTRGFGSEQRGGFAKLGRNSSGLRLARPGVVVSGARFRDLLASGWNQSACPPCFRRDPGALPWPPGGGDAERAALAWQEP